MASSSSNVVGVHYRVGKKIGEGSFGVIFEGTNLLNNQQVAIKFVRQSPRISENQADYCRNQEKAMHHNYEMSTEPTRYWLAAVSCIFRQSRSIINTLQPAYPMSTTLAKKAFTISWSSTSLDLA